MLNTINQNDISLSEVISLYDNPSNVVTKRLSKNRFIVSWASDDLIYFVVGRFYPNGSIKAYGDFCAPTGIGKLYFKSFVSTSLKELE